jgi:hypothetical protein
LPSSSQYKVYFRQFLYWSRNGGRLLILDLTWFIKSFISAVPATRFNVARRYALLAFEPLFAITWRNFHGELSQAFEHMVQLI